MNKRALSSKSKHKVIVQYNIYILNNNMYFTIRKVNNSSMDMYFIRRV